MLTPEDIHRHIDWAYRMHRTWKPEELRVSENEYLMRMSDPYPPPRKGRMIFMTIKFEEKQI